LNGLFSYWIYTTATAAPALFLALVAEQRRIRLERETLPYTTGFVISINAIIAGLIITGVHAMWFMTHNPRASVMSVVISVLFVISGIFGVRRKRFGLIAATILTLNPVWYVIGAFYIPRRWKDLGKKRVVVEPTGRIKRREYRPLY
jgi:hypothetical protein